jgi:hypothetical protein
MEQLSLIKEKFPDPLDNSVRTFYRHSVRGIIFNDTRTELLMIYSVDPAPEEYHNKRFETHSPIVMEFAVPPGGGQTPRQLRLRAQAVVIWILATQ